MLDQDRVDGLHQALWGKKEKETIGARKEWGKQGTHKEARQAGRSTIKRSCWELHVLEL